MTNIEKAIELLVDALDDLNIRSEWPHAPDKINKAITILKEKPEPTELSRLLRQSGAFAAGQHRFTDSEQMLKAADLLDQQTQEIEWLKGHVEPPTGEWGTFCIYCAEAIPYDPAEGIEKAWETMKAHDRTCSRNPLVAEIAGLKQSNGNAFVAGAKWWEFKKTQATMFPSDADKAEAEAQRRRYEFRHIDERAYEAEIDRLTHLVADLRGELSKAQEAISQKERQE